MESQINQRKRAKELFNGHLAEVKRNGKGKQFAGLLPIGFLKVGPNSFEQIGAEGKALDRDQVIALIGFERSADIFYIYSGDISNEETIDRLKLVEGIEQKFKGLPNVQIVSGGSGIAITVKPANVLFVLPVVFKFSENELKQLAANHMETLNIGEVETLAKSNFQDLDKLAAQVKRYKAKGFYVIENVEL